MPSIASSKVIQVKLDHDFDFVTAESGALEMRH